MRAFITFGDEKYRRTRELLRDEASALGVFDECTAYGPEDLAPAFLQRHAQFIRESARGYGYWIWKPHLILKKLNSLQDGDILMYADAGCEVNPAGRERLLQYFESVTRHPSGVFSFHFATMLNRAYTKMDVFQALDAFKLMDAQMHVAGIVLFRCCDVSRRFVSDWERFCEMRPLLDDQPSQLKNHPDFKDHRHDQSIFSLLCAQYGVATVLDETGGEGWPENCRYPIRAARRGPRPGFWQRLRRSFLKRRARFRWFGLPSLKNDSLQPLA